MHDVFNNMTDGDLNMNFLKISNIAHSTEDMTQLINNILKPKNKFSSNLDLWRCRFNFSPLTQIYAYQDVFGALWGGSTSSTEELHLIAPGGVVFFGERGRTFFVSGKEISVDNKRIKAVAAPTEDNDAATKSLWKNK